MSDDFQKGQRGDQQNVSNWAEYNRGDAYQRAANEPRTWGSPHSSALSFVPTGAGPVITGEHWILQSIVSIPFVVAGTLLYPITAIVTVIAGLLCTRIVPAFGLSGWKELLAYLPALAVFWLTMRWDQRAGDRHVGYRKIRTGARVLVFAFVGYTLAAHFFPARNASGLGTVITMPNVAGAIVGAVLGFLFLSRAEGWHDFWYRTLAMFRLRPTH